MIIRHATVAGQFYPGDPLELKKVINNYLSRGIKQTNDVPSILIVPHAGYVYSGQTAAAGYSQITPLLPRLRPGFVRGRHITKIIILGVSHSSYFDDIALDDSDYWETPLGQVETNKKLMVKLATEEIVKNREVHLAEHSLEVQLPFLQTVLNNFSITPILIGQVKEGSLEKLARKLVDNFDDKTLLIISSDLSHYPDSQTAVSVDQRTVNAIKSGDPIFFKKELVSLKRDYPAVDTFACGGDAIYVGMLVAQKIKANKIKVLAKTNSGEISGETNRVVGYTSIGFYK